MEHSQTSKSSTGHPYTGLLFGEGRKDKTFIKNLSSLKKFKYHTSKWTFLLDNASGGSPETILQKCCQTSSNRDFDIVICFIDLDKLKEDFPKNWEKEKEKIEKQFPNIHIFWHEDCLEDEMKKVIGKKNVGKKEINRIANKEVEKFVNSKYWKSLLKIIKDCEEKPRF